MCATSETIKPLTDKNYWDKCYNRTHEEFLNPDDWRCLGIIQLIRKIEAMSLNNQSVLEIGGGDARILVWLAHKYPSGKFAILDYSHKGCELAKYRAEQQGVPLSVHEADMFSPNPLLKNYFDIVYSQGLVEHFHDLPEVIKTKSAYLKPGGKMLTLIPNLVSPIYSTLVRWWSRRIWKCHVAYSKKQLVDAHLKAGLKVTGNGYLGSIEFGMVSSAIQDLPTGKHLEHSIYKWLCRLSSLIHWFEAKTFDYPTTLIFSPFIWVKAEKLKR